jgi:hypothetical protein
MTVVAAYPDATMLLTAYRDGKPLGVSRHGHSGHAEHRLWTSKRVGMKWHQRAVSYLLDLVERIRVALGNEIINDGFGQHPCDVHHVFHCDFFALPTKSK